jgi:23S rRNA (guanosine2251-2'-O)-methyltransferase
MEMRKLQVNELNRKSTEEYKKTPKLPLVLVLDDIRSMYNVGAVFRSADAFLVSQIYLCGITAKPPHREINKTAIGATESVEWTFRNTSFEALKELKKNDFRIIGFEHTDQSILLSEFSIKKEEKYALLFGNEVIGLREDLLNELDCCIEIPQYGTKHSLNISIAAGIAMYHFAMQLL